MDASGLDRQQCAVHMQRTVAQHIRILDQDVLTHLDRILRRSGNGWPGNDRWRPGPSLLAL